MRDRRLAVIGLGYVGLPVAVAFARAGVPIVGFDIDAERVAELRRGDDRTGEVSPAELKESGLRVTADAHGLGEADFFIVTVPTPIDAARRPDLGALLNATRLVAGRMRPGAIVVYESTVYPGATEEECIPVLERVSGLRLGDDFGVGYSPERINPGDRDHRLETITKIVAASDLRTLTIVADTYGTVVRAGIHAAPSIRVAEAAKVIENTQRDLNIALMNELSEIFDRLGIDTADVLAAAGTKWNFLPFHPGLVGGHCIGVDPYYLTHRAERAGFSPQVILAGRRTNDGVGTRVARECVRLLMQRPAGGRRVAILGLTFKEDVPDTRNSRVVDVVRELERFAVVPVVIDPVAEPDEARREHGIELASPEEGGPFDAVILAVPHAPFRAGGWDLVRRLLGPDGTVVMDVRGILDRASKPPGVTLWRL